MIILFLDILLPVDILSPYEILSPIDVAKLLAPRFILTSITMGIGLIILAGGYIAYFPRGGDDDGDDEEEKKRKRKLRWAEYKRKIQALDDKLWWACVVALGFDLLFVFVFEFELWVDWWEWSMDLIFN